METTVTYLPFIPTTRKHVGHPDTSKTCLDEFYTTTTALKCVLSGLESWVGSRLCNEECLKELLFRPLGWDSREKIFVLSLAFLPSRINYNGWEKVHWTFAIPHFGIMTWLLTQLPIHPNPQVQSWGSTRALKKPQGKRADGLRKPWGHQGGPERAQGSCAGVPWHWGRCWAETLHANLNLSLQPCTGQSADSTHFTCIYLEITKIKAMLIFW